MESDPLDLYQPSTLCLKKEDTGEINMNMYFMYVANLCSVAMPMALLALDRNVQQALHCTAARSWIFSTLVILHLSQDHDSDSNCEFHCRYPLPYLRPPRLFVVVNWLVTID